jgi:hypothetical protein
METELTFDNVMKIVGNKYISESRTEELYAVAQLLALGELTKKQQKLLGEKLVEIVERDHWWSSNGAFNDI